MIKNVCLSIQLTKNYNSGYPKTILIYFIIDN